MCVRVYLIIISPWKAHFLSTFSPDYLLIQTVCFLTCRPLSPTAVYNRAERDVRMVVILDNLSSYSYHLLSITLGNGRYQIGVHVNSSSFLTHCGKHSHQMERFFPPLTGVQLHLVWEGAAKLLLEDNFSVPLFWLDSSSNYSSPGPTALCLQIQ